jgi:PAS domain S-box-containing protein
MATAIQSLLKIDRFIGMAYTVDGKLYGTSMLMMKKDTPDPIDNTLKNFINLGAVSLRRKQADRLLKLSNEKFKIAFDSNPASININRLDDGAFVSINKGFTKTLGYTEEDAIGHTSIELGIWAKPEDRLKLVSEISKNGLVVSLETEFRAKNGSIRYGSMSASIIEIDGVKHIVSITNDINAYKLAEEKIKELMNTQQEINQQLNESYDATIEGWSRALDLRDKETEGHSIRVTEMTVKLAKSLEIAEEELIHLRRGTLLHDIGKMGVPDSILLKAGTLTEDEWEIMRLHPDYARELLQYTEFLKPMVDIPYCHHEKWDGSGYPQGLKGEEIPLGARIFAVVDVWDALISNRSYRAAWPKKNALAHIKKESGSHFDPQVVEAFLKMMADDISD